MERVKNKFKAVIFDMDGTIIKTEHVWDQAMKEVLFSKGIKNFTEKQHKLLESLSGIGLTKAAIVVKEEFKLVECVEELVGESKQIACKLFETGVEFIDGFENFHKKLQQNMIPTSVATNADQTSLNLLSRKLNLSKFFGENIYCVEMIGNKAKPNPDIFLHAAKKLNVEPHECVVFEDSLFGFQAAKAAGMKCIAIKNGINHKNLKLVNHAIDSYHEAEQALIKLFSKK